MALRARRPETLLTRSVIAAFTVASQKRQHLGVQEIRVRSPCSSVSRRSATRTRLHTGQRQLPLEVETAHKAVL